MAIDKAQVHLKVKNRTNREDFDINELLRTVLIDISNRFPFLEDVQQITMPSGQCKTSLIASTDTANVRRCRDVKSVVGPNGVKLARCSLFELQNWQEYASAQGSPVRYCIHGFELYVHPTPATSTQLSVYRSYTTGNTEAIELPEIFQEAVIEGVCFKVYETKGLATEAAAQSHKALYEEQINIMIASYGGKMDAPKV